ncbi:amidohydrolase family protein [Actinoallomurus soli]|uniref:amidohydrolase family protein n=1 Tax=Actinoallomurus soli TaxID=2952535 RepID=UPI0020936E7C|nr:amidohydrolase family protein [Actinoallomurus soli]MCO5967362.1 amidohydrolase [Actinoallomurus soli]
MIDVHHHAYHARLADELGVAEMAPGVPVPTWTPEDSLRVLDRNGLDGAVLSVLLPDAARPSAGLVRRVNEWTAELLGDRFAGLASLPMGDPDAMFDELAHALDVLEMDGVVLSASLPDGRLLGDPSLAPLFDELNRRRAVVFVHPNPAYGCSCTGPGVPPPLVDFVMDTTRAVAGLLFGGTLRRCPDVRFILAHGGGAVPYLAQRFELAGEWVVPGADARQVRDDLRRPYYEMAQSASAGALACLRTVTDESHILFGTDYPFMPEPVVASTLRAMSGPDHARALFGRFT